MSRGSVRRGGTRRVDDGADDGRADADRDGGADASRTDGANDDRADGADADGGEHPTLRDAPLGRQPDVTAADRAALATLVPSLTGNHAAVPGLAAVALSLLLVGGPLGAAGAALVVVLWAVALPTYAAAAAAVCYVALDGGTHGVVLLPGGTAAAVLATVGVAWLVATPLLADRNSPGALAATAVGAVPVAVVALAGLRLGDATIAAVLLAATVAFGLYALHRYTLVRLSGGDLQ